MLRMWHPVTLSPRDGMRSLFFSRNIFDNLTNGDTPDSVVFRMVSSVFKLEELVVYCPFSSSGLAAWLSVAGSSLKNFELRLDNITEYDTYTEIPSKLDCIRAARNLDSLKLWGVQMVLSLKWDVFHSLKNLEIVGARLEDRALTDALGVCPNLTHLLLLGCEGLRFVTIQNPHREQCKLDFFGVGNCSLTIYSSKVESLEVQGCSYIKVGETQCLKNLSIANNAGHVLLVHFGKLVALKTLSMRGIQWCWDAISTMLLMATEVDSMFQLPCLENVVVTVRSPLNAEQKMSTLDSLVRYAKNLKKMAIKILQMKSSHSSADEFFEEICKFRFMNRKIVSIE